LGLLGKTEWLVKYFHIKEERFDKVQVFVKKYGPWMAIFSFLPAFGSVICIALGMLRANPWLTLIAMTLGKGIRYILFAFAPELF
jgi:membrane protein YqaA with SNARE-associated domain